MGKKKDGAYFAPKILIFSLALLALFIVSFLLGRFPVRPLELIGMLASHLSEKLHLAGSFSIEPFWAPQTEAIFFAVRLPRIPHTDVPVTET